MKKTIKIIALAMVALMLMLALVSCGAKPNSDPEKAEAALKENGYEVKSTTVADVTTILASNEDMKTVTISYYPDDEQAKTAYEAMEKAYEEMEKLAEEAGEELDYEFGISGKMVWAGSADAIKAAS